MNCASVLESLLDAELSDIAGDGNSALAEHLRSCVRCRRVADQLLVDTRLLATAMPAGVTSPRVSRRTRYAVLAPAGVVAALLVVTLSRSPRQVHVPATTAQVMPDTMSAAAVSTSVPSTMNRTPVVRSAPPRVTAGVMRAFPRPVAVAPVRMESSMRSGTTIPVTTSSVVSVDPPAGVRATILHTSNPKLVVVWLY
jgi:hypothetical protein